MNIAEEIKKLKKEKNAVVLAHFYQKPEVQDIADFVDDSLGLSQKAAKTEADMIIFAGVKFMAETAKIINPQKKVILPDINAGCSLADSCSFNDLKKFKEENSDYKIVTYINSSAEVKTISDIICTSSNAEKIVNSFDKNEKLLFVPDKNLGSYIVSKTGRNMKLWNGTCKVHDDLKTERILKLKEIYKNSKIIAHPECKNVILEIADFVGSTAAMVKFIEKDEAKSYIIATETGIIHQMKKIRPDKEYIVVSENETCNCNDCEYMKVITIEKIYNSLRNEETEIILDENIIEKARIPIMKMLEISGK